MLERPILILAVDDDPAELALLRKLIPRLGYESIEARDGTQALETIYQKHPDLVLLDVMIPEINGFDVCRRVRDDPVLAGFPILLFTALDRPEDNPAGVG